jgi:hypothetical protein
MSKTALKHTKLYYNEDGFPKTHCSAMSFFRTKASHLLRISRPHLAYAHNVYNEPVLGENHRCGIRKKERFYNAQVRKHRCAGSLGFHVVSMLTTWNPRLPAHRGIPGLDIPDKWLALVVNLGIRWLWYMTSILE